MENSILREALICWKEVIPLPVKASISVYVVTLITIVVRI